MNDSVGCRRGRGGRGRSCRWHSLFFSSRPHEEGSGLFHDVRVAGILFFFSSRPHEDERCLFHSVRVLVILFSFSFSSDHTKTDENCSLLFVSPSFSFPFILHQPHEDGRCIFRSGRVVVVLLSFCSVLFVSPSFSFRSPPTTRRRMKTVPFWSCCHSPFILHRPHEDGRRLMHSVRVVVVFFSFSSSHTKTDEA